MKNAVADFLKELEETGRFSPGDAILLAVSGGMDSVAMAHFFHETGQKFGIAHCNFQLRGEDSDGDEAFVRGLAAQFRAPFFCEKFDTADFAARRKLSIQMAARELRYAFFEKTRAENGFRFVATAHHLDDSRETAVLNFFRGTGFRGLRGMLPVRGRIIRPLLHLTKNELREAAKKQFPELVFREDRSNATDDYDRNFLRHKVLPEVEKLSPGFFEKRLDENMKRARQVELFFEETIKVLRQEVVQTTDNQTVVDASPLIDTPVPTLFLGEILRPFGFREAQIMPIITALGGERGRLFLSKEHILTVDGFRLFITPKEADDGGWPNYAEIEWPQARFTVVDGLVSFESGLPPGGTDTKTDLIDRVYFDKKDLVFPLVFRHWQPGDRFRPSGMGGQSKKLQDFFKDKKLARPEKHRVWLLENGNGEIIWIVGMRRSNLPTGAADCSFEFKKGEWAPESLPKEQEITH